MCLQFIHHNNIAQKVPLDGRMTFEQIAEACELDKDDSRRMLRLAMTDNLFREPERGIVAHSATSQILAVNPLLFAWVSVTTRELAIYASCGSRSCRLYIQWVRYTNSIADVRSIK